MISKLTVQELKHQQQQIADEINRRKAKSIDPKLISELKARVKNIISQLYASKRIKIPIPVEVSLDMEDGHIYVLRDFYEDTISDARARKFCPEIYAKAKELEKLNKQLVNDVDKLAKQLNVADYDIWGQIDPDGELQ